MEEVWKSVPGYVDCLVSNMGRFHNLKTNKIREIGRNRDYPAVVVLREDGHLGAVGFHRLVALAFVPGYFEGALVNHRDGNPRNFDVENLEWVTHSGNMQHAWDTGLSQGRRGRIVSVVSSVTHEPIDDPRIIPRRYTRDSEK
jgi:hypothetical protein